MNQEKNIENIKLVRLYQESSSQKQRDIILKRVFKINEGFVSNLVKSYPLSIQEDVKQECLIALFKAIEDFDLSYENNFMTYAKYKIKHYTRDLKVKQTNSITSIYAYRVLNAYNKHKGDNKDLVEIARDINVKPETLLSAIMSRNALLHFDKDPEDIIEDSDEDDFIQRENVQKYIGNLTDRERFVIKNYFGLESDPVSMSDIGKLMNPVITRMGVHKLYKRAILKLRKDCRLQSID